MTLCVVLPVAAASGVVFSPRYTDSPGEGFFDPLKGAQRRKAFEFALAIWQTRIPGAMNANVDVDASFDSMGGTQYSATLGSGGPSAFEARFGGAPRSDVAYPSALANYLAATDLNGSSSDIEIQFNSDVDGSVLGSSSWYYGLDGRTPSRDLDFVSVSLHELTHSLGFISTGYPDGTFEADTSRGTMPDSFDAYLVSGSGAKLTSLAAQPYNVTHPIYWSGPLGVQQYQQAFRASSRPRIYSPSTFEDGSSLSHLDEDKFTGKYDLMTPIASETVHVPDDITRGIMADIGWQVAGTGDADLDGLVDIVDVFSLIKGIGSQYGKAGYSMSLDLNLDGVIDTSDLAAMASHFGEQSLLGKAPSGNSLFAGQRVVLPGVSESLVYAVPEPLTIGLLLAGLLAAGGRRSREMGRV